MDGIFSSISSFCIILIDKYMRGSLENYKGKVQYRWRRR